MSEESGKKSIFPSFNNTQEAGRDPLQVMIEIAKDNDLSDEYKKILLDYSRERFKNRRKMAYISLWTIVLSVVFLILAGYIDGIIIPLLNDGVKQNAGEKCTFGILAAISKNQNLLSWLEGFLTTIIAAYYGVSAWRPSS
jgi:hypothetical protein